MPSLPPERFAPLSALGLGEKDAWLYETRRHDGLGPIGQNHGLRIARKQENALVAVRPELRLLRLLPRPLRSARSLSF